MRLHTVVLGVTLVLALLATPCTTTAQPPGKVFRIGVLSPIAPGTPSIFEPFYQGLRDLGYVEGQHIVFEHRYAEGNFDRFPDLAAELVRLPVDLVFTSTEASVQAAIHATTTIPIVFVGALDPVGRGLVASLARPGGNVTGVAFDQGPEIAGKQLELLKAAVPTVSRVAMLVGHERWPTDEAQEQVWERAARGLGLTLRYFYVGRSEALTAWAFPAITADAPPIDALHVGGGPPVFGNRRQIADFALQHRLPMIGAQRPFAEAGSLLSYGPTQREIQGRAVVLVDKIIKGAKPADLPVEQPTKFDFVINLKTAKALGLTIPPTLLFQADEVFR
jgi:putative tryptophan/tyrosine transport system substrate-binding protein